ncbi:MAG: DUF433 domain-containing protein [Gemmatimonadaceae bacterium]
MPADDSSLLSSGTVGGVPVFPGTRVPLALLRDHLARGASVREFLRDHPSVTEHQVYHLLASALDRLIAEAPATARAAAADSPEHPGPS